MGGRRKSDRYFWVLIALLAALTVANTVSLYRFNKLVVRLNEAVDAYEKAAKFMGGGL